MTRQHEPLTGLVTNERAEGVKTITLQPLTMRMPSRAEAYAPSQILPSLTIPMADFVDEWAISATPIKVSFADDHVSDWVTLPGYGLGLGAWYIVEERRLEVGG